MKPEESFDNGELPRGRAHRALFVLALVSFTNYVDRMILPAVSQPIKLEFGLSDTQIGLLNGLAFVVLYAASGVPLARLADRTSRPLVLAGALAFWSIATATCGFVRHFWQLALARACVGIGESACQPVGYAIISDYFPPDRRASAMAWFLVGNSLGVTAGFALGGWLGQTYGWRAAFVAVGIPGIALSLAVARLPRVRKAIGRRVRLLEPWHPADRARALSEPHLPLADASERGLQRDDLWADCMARFLLHAYARASATHRGDVDRARDRLRHGWRDARRRSARRPALPRWPSPATMARHGLGAAVRPRVSRRAAAT